MKAIPTIPDQFKDEVELINTFESILDDTISYIVELKREFTANERGQLLLNLEESLCLQNPKIRVWHVAIGDKNSLRNLRGISVN